MNSKKIFNFEDVGDFDKHIDLSIPDYRGLSDIFTAISLEYLNPQGALVDLGCSTGRFVNELPKIKDCNYFGVDIVDIRAIKSGYDFLKVDILEYLKSIETADIIVCMFTLQFLGRHKRKEVVKELVRLNENGASILISEKVYMDDSKLNNTLQREHIKSKRKNFSDTEILDKDYKLFGSMFCLSEREMSDELRAFKSSSLVWQSYTFKGWFIL